MRIIKSKDINDDFFEYSAFDETEDVRAIVNEVKRYGDCAVRKFTKKFDKIDLKRFELTKDEIKKAYKEVDKEDIYAIKKAAANIRFFANEQLKQFKGFKIKKKNLILGQRVVPIEKVGCYVPGGRYPLPSSALMSVIPAKAAGVKEVIVCSPNIKPATIVAADIAGADRIFTIGGIQAVSAMAYGTKSVPKVDKIVGPGNKYVTAAKKEVYGVVGIDFIAGPSEVLIIADKSGNAGFIAADLLAQAEHDPDAVPILITTSKKLAEDVNEQLEAQLYSLKTKQIARLALGNGMIIIVNDIEDTIRITNKRAPEHLEVQVRNPNALIDKLINYGSLFIGNYSAEVYGDYCSGTNHILPTNGAARYTGGLSVKDFIKFMTYQKIDKKASADLTNIASRLAEIEGLDAHKKAADIRRRR